MGIMHKAGNGNQGWTLKTDTYSNGWHLRFDAIFSGANYTFQKNSYLKKDIWTYIAVTYSSNAGEQATIYTSNESGVLSAITSPNTNTTSTDTYTSDAGQDLIIGSKEGDSTKFNGLMDEIRIYNRALATSSADANSVPPNPALANALPIADVSQFSSAEVLLIILLSYTSSACPVYMLSFTETVAFITTLFSSVKHILVLMLFTASLCSS
jgi:hypothetical protein